VRIKQSVLYLDPTADIKKYVAKGRYMRKKEGHEADEFRW
jgi:hypothetical protein